MTMIPTMAPPCTVPMMPFTPAMQAGVQAGATQSAITPVSGPSVHATVTAPSPAWPTTLYGAGGAYSGAPGAAPQASFTPVSGSATVTFSAGVSGTVGPTVTNDTPGEPGGRPHRPPAISHRACDVTRRRAAAAEELTIAPTMLPALCMAPMFEQPYGMWPYGAAPGATAAYTSPYTKGTGWAAQPDATAQATPPSVWPTITHHPTVPPSIRPTITHTHPTVQPTVGSFTGPSQGGVAYPQYTITPVTMSPPSVTVPPIMTF
jgi:hypothetical protein